MADSARSRDDILLKDVLTPDDVFQQLADNTLALNRVRTRFFCSWTLMATLTRARARAAAQHAGHHQQG